MRAWLHGRHDEGQPGQRAEGRLEQDQRQRDRSHQIGGADIVEAELAGLRLLVLQLAAQVAHGARPIAALLEVNRELRRDVARALGPTLLQSQPQRTRTLAQFKTGHVTVLVATNVAARGIHVDNLDLVVNVDPHATRETTVHLNMPALGMGWHDSFIAHDEITGETWTATTIYLTPTTLSAITVNFIMSLSGGLMVGYLVSKGDPFWTMSGGLAGVIAVSAGADVYHPSLAYILATSGGMVASTCCGGIVASIPHV